MIAFLTILGYSLYDTIVVFDRIRENETRFLSQKPPYEDVINVSMNQVLMRSIMTTFSSVIPVLSMLVVGAWIMGQTTLEEFGLALLIGLITGAYSSLFVAAPLLGYLKKTDANWKSRTQPRATGEALREMVVTGHIAGTRRVRPRAAMVAAADERRCRGRPGRRRAGRYARASDVAALASAATAQENPALTARVAPSAASPSQVKWLRR